MSVLSKWFGTTITSAGPVEAKDPGIGLAMLERSTQGSVR